MKVERCLSCSSKSLKKIFDLGEIPPVNSFLTPEQSTQERKFPLFMQLCSTCSLVQLGETIPPDVLFKYYQHLSSASQSNIQHLTEVVTVLKNMLFDPSANKLLEVGSNDGTLLRIAKKNGFDVVGVDPAENLAESGNDGVRTVTAYFGEEIAKGIVAKEGKFDFVVGLNVFAHDPGFIDMLRGVEEALDEDGIAVFECAYLFDTLLTGCFDTTYHEHVVCWSLTAFDTALEIAGLHGIHVEKIPTQGGSLRVYASRSSESRTLKYNELLKLEDRNGVARLDTYEIINKKVKHMQEELPKLLASFDGPVVGLGAPARGVVLVNACKLTSDNLKYVIDDTPLKLDRYIPGTTISVKTWEVLSEENIHNFLLLSWNYYPEIEKKLKKYVSHAKIIVPFPKLEVREF